MAEVRETLLYVPHDLVRQFAGLSMDIGNSVIKLIYRAKEDKDGLTNNTSHLRLVSFPREHLNEALDYVLERADIRRNDDGTEQPTSIYTTGIGCTQFGKIISGKPNVKLRQVSELDCFARSFVYLVRRLPRTELLHAFVEDVVAEPVANVAALVAALNHGQQTTNTSACDIDLPSMLESMQLHVGRPATTAATSADSGCPSLALVKAEPDALPCVLVVCGSAGVFYKIEKNGEYKIIDLVCNHHGRTFVGIGSLLTGSKSFDELVALAAEGDSRNVDECVNDLITPIVTDGGGDDDIYETMMEDNTKSSAVIFSFGKAIGSTLDAFRREDLARTWLSHVARDLVARAESACARHGVRRLFFGGSFCNSPLVRRIFTAELVARNLFLQLCNQSDCVQFDFVKSGSHLGALGCVINEVEKFI